MISVNSLQILLLPVGLILAAHYYLEYLVDIEHLVTIPTNQTLPASLVGKWASNDILSSAENLYNGDERLNGVESAAEYKGKLYGCDSSNRIFELNLANNQLQYLATANGRVLGVRIDSAGRLFYLQADKGIYSLSLTTKNAKIETVFEHDPTAEADNPRNITFLDDFAFVERENGQHLFYISQSSRRWALEELTSQILENENSGRVLEFDAQSKQLSSLAENLHFPNGVELVADKSAILVAEFNQRRIVRIDITASKRGQTKVIVDGLLGEPDNIRRSKSNTYLIALTSARTLENCHLLDRYPFSVVARQAFLYFHRSVEVGLDRILSRVTDVSSYKERWAKFVLHSTIKYMTRGASIEIDETGKLLNVFLSENGKVQLVSQISELKSDKPGKRLLFLGSFFDHPAYKLYI